MLCLPMCAVADANPTYRIARRSSAHAEAARNDVAKNFRGAALNGELWRDRRSKRNLLIQARAIAVTRQKRGKLAHAKRKLLLPQGAQILHDRAFNDRLSSCH